MSSLHPLVEPTPSVGEWMDREAAAEEMVPLVGRLHRNNGVVTSIYGRSLVGAAVFDILKAHRFARRVDGEELSPSAVLALLKELEALNLAPASVDVARMLAKFRAADERTLSVFLHEEFADLVDAGGHTGRAPRDVVLFGFGRIGRLVARLLITHRGDGNALRLRAVVVRGGGPGDLAKRASLLRRDSVHGPFPGTITIDEAASQIVANGTAIKVFYADDPSSLDYEAHGISDAIVVDNTGRWRDRGGLSQHLLSAGASRVLLTAPAKGEIKNIVHGINHGSISPSDTIVAAASCTTNAVAPVLQAMHQEYGLIRGHIETVHSYTNDQNLIDNYHKGERRGRSAVLNMVITETGAARAVVKALPELEGRLTGSSIRVPTPDVSLAVLTLTLTRRVDKATLNAFLRAVSLHSPLHRQVDYIESPDVVSTDFLGSRRAGIVDGLATIATGDEQVVLYVWYDNEFGYSSQVVRVLETLAGDHPPVFPRQRPALDSGALAGNDGVHHSATV